MDSCSESNSTECPNVALLNEGAHLFDAICSTIKQTPSGVGETPTTPIRIVDLAAAEDEGNGVERNCSTSSKGRYASSICT